MEQILVQICASAFVPEAVTRGRAVGKVWAATLLKRGSVSGVLLWIFSLNLEAALQTNGVIESDLKEVINKQHDNASKCKDDGKTKMTQITGFIRPMLI